MKRDRKRPSNDLVYGLRPGMIGDAEVEMSCVPEVEDELLRERFIEPVERLQPLDIFGSLLVADVEGTSRCSVHDEKRERGHRQDGGDEPEDPVHGKSHHAGSGLLTGVFAVLGSNHAPGGQAARHPVLADAVAFRRPITLTRPNTVVKVVSVHLMIEQRDDSIAQFYVSRTRGLNTTGERTNGYRIYELRSSSAATSPTRSLTKDASITIVSPL